MKRTFAVSGGSISLGLGLGKSRCVNCGEPSKFQDTLLLVEHPPTYTGGRATLPEHLLTQGLDVVEIDRGGSVTFHGPGQIVAYPIVDLRQRGRDVHQYLRDLEAVLIRTLAAYNLEGEARGGLTGAWVGSSKVASIGVNVRHWITTHGLALNDSPANWSRSSAVPWRLALAVSSESLKFKSRDRQARAQQSNRADYSIKQETRSFILWPIGSPRSPQTARKSP